MRARSSAGARALPRVVRVAGVRSGFVWAGAGVVDVGINRGADAGAKKGYRLVGDVDFHAVAPKCAFITPVPGGVGPMTVAMLMANTLKAFRVQTGVDNAAV